MKCPKCDGAITLMGDYVGFYLVCTTEGPDGCSWDGVYITSAILRALENAISKMSQELLNNAS